MKEFTFTTKSGLKLSGHYAEFTQKPKKNIKNVYNLILIHAFPLDSEMYLNNFYNNKFKSGLNKILPTNGKLRIFLPDMPGFGSCELFNTTPTNLLPYVEVINEIINHFQIKTLFIGGCSMGGYIALEYVRKSSIIIKGLILIDTKPFADDDEQKQNRFNTIELLNKSLESHSENEKTKIKIKDLYEEDNNVKSFIDNLYSRIISQITLKRNPKIALKILNLMQKQKVLGVIHALYGMAGRNDTSDILKNLQIEPLIIVGENDIITPIEIAQYMKNIIPKSNMEIIASAGHLSNVENSIEFNQNLLNYLHLKFNLS